MGEIENKTLLRKLAEETIYTSKGHFKACDIRRFLVSLAIWSCAIASVLDLAFDWGKSLDIIGLIGAISLLIWNERDGHTFQSRHHQLANDYLALHKEIRELYYSDCITQDATQALSKKVRDTNKKKSIEISFLARKWAQRAIQKGEETDNWFEDGVEEKD